MRKETRVDLVGELERILEVAWRYGDSEPAFAIGAAQIYKLLHAAEGFALDAEWRDFYDLAALEADGADELRGASGASSKGEDCVERSDADARVAAAQIEVRRQRFNFLALNEFFLFEFANTVFRVFQLDTEGVSLTHKFLHPLSAKKLTEPLKWLAARVDELEDIENVVKSEWHDVVTDYRARLNCRATVA